MIQIKKFVIIVCTLFATILSYSQTTLNLVNSYSISDDVNEPSGLAYDKINNQLFTVSDTGDLEGISNGVYLLLVFNTNQQIVNTIRIVKGQ